MVSKIKKFDAENGNAEAQCRLGKILLRSITMVRR